MCPHFFAAFFYVDMSFMVWVLLGLLGVRISQDLAPSPGSAGGASGDRTSSAQHGYEIRP
jgi:nitrate/nitrite transporter NarK